MTAFVDTDVRVGAAGNGPGGGPARRHGSPMLDAVILAAGRGMPFPDDVHDGLVAGGPLTIGDALA